MHGATVEHVLTVRETLRDWRNALDLRIKIVPVTRKI